MTPEEKWDLNIAIHHKRADVNAAVLAMSRQSNPDHAQKQIEELHALVSRWFEEEL